MGRNGSRTVQRLLAAAVIAMMAVALAGGLAWAPVSRDALNAVDLAAYDAVYKVRPAQTRYDVPVTLIEIDGAALEELARVSNVGWPWPRGESGWASVIRYLQEQGARAVVFDLLFNSPSALSPDDDVELADAIDSATVPLVFAADVHRRFAPQVKKPVILGAADISREKVYRTYDVAPGATPAPSLALASVRAAGLAIGLDERAAFLLHYHGPHRTAAGDPVYRTVNAASVLWAAMGRLRADAPAPARELFQDRIVVIGATAAGTYDLKSAPVARARDDASGEGKFPGVVVHATAIDNLINGDRVTTMSPAARLVISACAALVVAGVTVAGRSWWIKLAAALVVLAGVVALSTQGMLGPQMRWLPPAMPVLAIVMASVGGLVWSYRLEDARARLLLKAISSCVSPAVADTLAADPRALAVGGQQREMTVLFSDMQGFTDLTERLRERIEPLLNFYLGQLSARALAHDGTIDKFIGDAMMVFWNAPLPQPAHALQACWAALEIAERERQITPRLIELGAPRPFTRIGIHTGPMVVGFFGSSERLSYTVIGDNVNLAARLEPANKLYGTQILVSAATADAVRGEMLLRPVDRLCVYGKQESCDLFALLSSHTAATDAQRQLCDATARALEAYRRRDWARSRQVWVEILDRMPDDALSKLYVARIAELEAHPPAEDWDGSFAAAGK